MTNTALLPKGISLVSELSLGGRRQTRREAEMVQQCAAIARLAH